MSEVLPYRQVCLSSLPSSPRRRLCPWRWHCSWDWVPSLPSSSCRSFPLLRRRWVRRILNAFLRNEKIYDNSNYNIHTLSILDENNSYDIATKKAIYNSSKYYFPNVNKRLFVISENNKNNYISSLDKKQFPIIIIETNNGIRKIYTYKDFINAIKTNRFTL